MTMFIHFFCLCPLGLAIKLNFNISKVVYSLFAACAPKCEPACRLFLKRYVQMFVIEEHKSHTMHMINGVKGGQTNFYSVTKA